MRRVGDFGPGLVFSGLAAALTILGLFACSSTTKVVSSSDGGAGDPSSLPEIPADQLGASCSGFGTSPGDSALFSSDMCPAGACLVDARTSFELYCSADCDSARCPSGYLCQDVTVGGPKRACFRDPNAPPTTDAGTDSGDAGLTFLDQRLPAYKNGSATLGDVALRDYADPTGAKRDLVIVVVDGAWSGPDNMQLKDLNVGTYARAEILSVLIEGTAFGKGATASDLTQWHTKYSHVDTALDPELAGLGAGLGQVTAVPSWYVFSARTMKQIATERGYMDPTTLASTIETWRALAK
jgi:hypothetical protein